MSDKMTIVFLKSTGHVLAALTRTAEPETALKPEALAGSGLLVREPNGTGSARLQFTLAPQALDVLVADKSPAVLLEPRRYHIVDKKPERLALLAPTLTPTVAIDNVAIKVSFTSPVSRNTNVSVLVEGETVTRQSISHSDQKVILQGGSDVDTVIPRLEEGSYRAIAFVADHLPKIEEFQVP